MRYIGFIKEHNPIKESLSIEVVMSSPDNNDEISVLGIIEYLKNNGVLILGWMGYFMDLEKDQPICPDSYYSDGVWVWPAYFPYYLEKYPHYPLDKEFKEYFLSKDFKNNTQGVSFDKDEFERELSRKLNVG